MATRVTNAELLQQVQVLTAKNQEYERLLSEFQEKLAVANDNPSQLRGNIAEHHFAKLTGGTVTTFFDHHDVINVAGVKFEVKVSKVNKPAKGTSRRYNWSNLTGGADNCKVYDYLVLMAEKDSGNLIRYPNAEDKYLYFVVPRNKVQGISSEFRGGSQCQLNCNFEGITSPRMKELLKYMVSAAYIKETYGVKL